MSDTIHRGKTSAASTPGSFAPHTRSQSEAALQDAADEPNHYAEYFDRKRGSRPLRPYLPLTAADDDEFFDAPIGAVIALRDPASSTTLHYERTSLDAWHLVDGFGERHDRLDIGELWGSLVATGAVRGAVLRAPDGWLIGDREGWVERESVDQPLADVRERLDGATVRAVSQSWHQGPNTGGSIAPGDGGLLDAEVSGDGYMKFKGRGKGASVRSFVTSEYETFQRGDDVVVRRTTDAGLGVEFVYRRVA